MYIVVGSIYIIAILLSVFICLKRSKLINNNISGFMDDIIIMSAICAMSIYGVFIFSNELVCNLIYIVYFLCCDILIAFLLQFFIFYSKIDVSRKHYKYSSIGYILLDTVANIANYWTHHSYILHKELILGKSVYVYDAVNNHICHFIASNYMGILCIIVLFRKLKKSRTIYRLKYSIILMVFLGTVLINASAAILGVSRIYTSIIYVAGMVCFHYFTLFYVPDRIRNSSIKMVAKNMKDGFIVVDAENVIVHSNHLAEKMLGVREGDHLYGNSIFSFWMMQHKHMIDGDSFSKTLVVDKKQKYFTVMKFDLSDDSDFVIGSYFFIVDKTEAYEKEYAEHYAQTHDSLTGLYNREYFFSMVSKRLKEDPDTEYILVSSDVENFKLVNDLFGNERGDELLIRIANGIKDKVKDGDLYARVSGDKFALFMPKKNYRKATFTNLPKEFAYVEENIFYPLHIDFGVYEIVDGSVPVNVMYDRANMALQTIKKDYNNQIAFYDEKIRQAHLDGQKLLSKLEVAMNNNEVTAYLQPQFDGDGNLLGAEALFRWIDSEMGLISPAEIIPLVEANGMIGKLDYYIWRLACSRLAYWKSIGREDLYISINISPKDFYYMDIYNILTGFIGEYEVKPCNLHLEITETALGDNPEKIFTLIEKLQEFGFTVEMDDFGSGYSSLNMLKDTPVDVVKIDMLFLQKTDKHDRLLKVVESVIDLCKKLNMKVIVEGVENNQMLDTLQQYDCDAFQGYYFSKPIPAEEFEEKYGIN